MHKHEVVLCSVQDLPPPTRPTPATTRGGFGLLYNHSGFSPPLCSSHLLHPACCRAPLSIYCTFSSLCTIFDFFFPSHLEVGFFSPFFFFNWVVVHQRWIWFVHLLECFAALLMNVLILASLFFALHDCCLVLHAYVMVVFVLDDGAHLCNLTETK